MGISFLCLRAPFAAAVLVLAAAGCETRASLTKARVRKVEKGLLRAVVLKGTKPERASLRERMDFYKVPGAALAIMDGHKVEWTRSYGYRDIRSYAPVDGDTLFQAGALAQPVAAVAAMALVERGRLELDADASIALRGLDLPKTVAGSGAPPPTLRGFLSHASGLASQTFEGRSRTEPLPSLEQVFSGEPPASNRPLFEGYRSGAAGDSEADYILVQQMIANAGGRPFPAFAAESVFEPLAMSDSSFEAPLPAALEGRAAAGHLRPGPGVEGGWRNYCESAAKGLWTSAGDYAEFLLALVGDAMGRSSRLLSPSSARAILTPGPRDRGFGVVVEGSGNDVHFSVRGRTCGYSALAVFYPARGQGLVILANSDNGGLLADEIRRAVSAAYDWPHFRPEEKAVYRLDQSAYEPYVGRYVISPDYALDVSHEDYYLVIQPTGQSRTKFYVESETVFFSIDPFIRIQFRRDDRGDVDALVLWQEDFEQKAARVR